MKTSKELLEQRGVLDTELTALAAQIDAKTITTDGEARFDTLMGEIETLNGEIKKAEIREEGLKALEGRKVAGPSFAIGGAKTDNEDQVKKQFRFTKLITDMADGVKLDGFYDEINKEGLRDMANCGVNHSETRGFVVPSFITGNDRTNEQRDLSTSTSDTGKAGYTMQTDLLTGEYIDNLRNALVTTSMGMKFLSGLKGNITIPRKTTNSGASWLTETGSITAADLVLDQPAMSPKRLGNAMNFSRQLLIQSSMDIEALVRQDLIESQALALQAAIIHGPSTGNGPLGILNTSGIGSVVINTNGGALTWAALVALETAVANANAMSDNHWYLTNSKVRGAAKGIVRDTGSGLFLWGSDFGGGGDQRPLNGYGAKVTNAVPSTNVKGSSGAVCSSLIFGCWSNLIVGQWGGLVITANPYALDLSAQIRVSMNAWYDVEVRHAESFAAINDITT